jgi:hypothetical protein
MQYLLKNTTSPIQAHLSGVLDLNRGDSTKEVVRVIINYASLLYSCPMLLHVNREIDGVLFLIKKLHLGHYLLRWLRLVSGCDKEL